MGWGDWSAFIPVSPLNTGLVHLAFLESSPLWISEWITRGFCYNAPNCQREYRVQITTRTKHGGNIVYWMEYTYKMLSEKWDPTSSRIFSAVMTDKSQKWAIFFLSKLAKKPSGRPARRAKEHFTHFCPAFGLGFYPASSPFPLVFTSKSCAFLSSKEQ